MLWGYTMVATRQTETAEAIALLSEADKAVLARALRQYIAEVSAMKTPQHAARAGELLDLICAAKHSSAPREFTRVEKALVAAIVPGVVLLALGLGYYVIWGALHLLGAR